MGLRTRKASSHECMAEVPAYGDARRQKEGEKGQRDEGRGGEKRIKREREGGGEETLDAPLRGRRT